MTTIIAICAAFISVGMVVFGVYSSAQHHDRKKFIGHCLEFHTVDRCHEFWRYDRLDLGMKQ